MDATTLNTIVGIVGIVVGVIGAGVGIIGWKCISAANNYNAKANKGAAIYQNSPITICQGLSASDTIELAKHAAEETVKRNVDSKDYLKLDFAAHSMTPLFGKQSSRVYAFPFQTRSGKQYTLKFEKVQNKNECPCFKCSIIDIDGNNINLHVQLGELGVLPQNIYKYLHFRDKGCTEVTITSNQIVAGQTQDGSIILASIEPGHPFYYLPVKVAIYVPFEVTL